MRRGNTHELLLENNIIMTLAMRGEVLCSDNNSLRFNNSNFILWLAVSKWGVATPVVLTTANEPLSQQSTTCKSSYVCIGWAHTCQTAAEVMRCLLQISYGNPLAMACNLAHQQIHPLWTELSIKDICKVYQFL